MARQKREGRQYPVDGHDVFISMLDWYREDRVIEPGQEASDGRGGEGQDYNEVQEGN